MLGGLLMGGLIGSMLFGGHGGGVGLLDLVLIGGGLFLLFRFLKTRRAATQTAGPMNFQSVSPDVEYEPAGGGGFGQLKQPSVELPPGFDEAEFMKGARAAYQRVQSSWNKRDLEDLRQFTSKEVWEEMDRQAKEDPAPGATEIIRLNAELQKAEQIGTQTVVSVLFDVLMREDPSRETASQVQEIWHFSRDESVPGSFWLLEGIQQVG
jgi:predicted lipid-binding transport protein (Tim44 family)